MENYIITIENIIRNKIESLNTKYNYEPTIFGINDTKLLDIAHKVRVSQMLEGYIAQVLIGNYPGWEDLGRGHPSKLDCRKLDNSVILELKNKYNTCNCSSKSKTLECLAEYKVKNPETTCILGIVNSKVTDKILIKEHEVNGVVVYEVHGILKIILNKRYNSIINFVRNLMF
tara:strand:+ start:4554 stop:5072 length:519 start_codon:yes stop_codon:yes gene_type:complete